MKCTHMNLLYIVCCPVSLNGWSQFTNHACDHLLVVACICTVFHNSLHVVAMPGSALCQFVIKRFQMVSNFIFSI